MSVWVFTVGMLKQCFAVIDHGRAQASHWFLKGKKSEAVNLSKRIGLVCLLFEMKCPLISIYVFIPFSFLSIIYYSLLKHFLVILS